MTSDVLAGFNANIDVVHHGFSDGAEPELFEEIGSMEQLRSSLKYCRENSENHEVDYSGLEIDGGKEFIGGQAGIVSDFLAKTGNTAVFYTPYLSRELADMLDERVLYPVSEDGKFVLKSVRDAANSDRTKKNHIFEFEGERTGRLILSDSLKGYGPYLPREVEDNLRLLEKNVDCCFLSGFHNVSGNMEAKIEKARKQISRIEKPAHLEYVHDPDTSELVVERIASEVDSLGLDETELGLICEMEGIDCPENPNFGEAFAALKKLIEKLGLERIHLHTYRYHIAVATDGYLPSLDDMRKSMLYGEVCAIQAAEIGDIPDSEAVKDFDMDDKHLKGVEQLEDFGDFHDLEDFSRAGKAVVDGKKVVGIPVIIHEDPERTVGMGDLISSGAFSNEAALQDS